jgi:hypothetical protein
MVACFLIESILRKTPYFTYYPLLRQEPACDSPIADDRLAALQLAADEYTRWYSECFDQGSATIICGDERLPVVNWEYDFTVWEQMRAAIAKDQSAQETIVGRKVLSTRTGVKGYLLMVEGGAWVSCFLTGEVRNDWCTFDWHHGQGEPPAEVMARLGRLDGALDEARQVDLARGKTITGLGRGYALWPEFDHKPTMWVEHPEYYPGMRRIHVKWYP